MTWTFDLTLATAKDRIRRAIGDTDTAAQLRQDEEVAAVLALAQGDEDAAIASLASGLAIEYAQRPDSISTSGDSISWRERVKAWTQLASDARARSTIIVSTLEGVWSELLVRTGFDEYESEYDPNRVEPTW